MKPSFNWVLVKMPRYLNELLEQEAEVNEVPKQEILINVLNRWHFDVTGGEPLRIGDTLHSMCSEMGASDVNDQA